MSPEQDQVAEYLLSSKFPLRDYQIEWIDAIYEAWRTGARRVLAQLPTGGGKTVALSHISKNFFVENKKVLVIAHRLELIEQAAEKLFAVIGEPVGTIKHGIEPNYHRRIQVGSIQTLLRRDLKTIVPEVGLLVCDEAHHATATSYRQIFDFYKQSLILGVTATPLRMDGVGFEDLFEHLVVGEPTSTLIKRGYLCPYRLFVSEETISTVGVKKSKKDFQARDLALAVTTQISPSDIYRNWRNYGEGKRTVIFASSLEHSKAIAKTFINNEVMAMHLDGETPDEQRRQMLKQFEAGSIKVITNYQILTEGYDCENLECVYCLRPTLSTTLWLQMVGRSLRTSHSKPYSIIIDLTENWKVHGLPDDERQWSLSASVTKKTFVGDRTLVCHQCTHVFKVNSQLLQPISWSMGADGLLVENYQVHCPHCGATIEFQLKESKRYHRMLRLKSSIFPEIKEVDLTVNPRRLKEVYHLIITQRLKQLPTKEAYKAIFMGLISKINHYTLGDWREIVRMVEPSESKYSQKAWQLYNEALIRHKNRLAALAHVQKRQQRVTLTSKSQQHIKNDDNPLQKEPNRENQQETQNAKLVGNPDFKSRYSQEWNRSVSHLQPDIAQFFTREAGLFFVEKSHNVFNISIEVINSDWVKRLRQKQVEEAFTKGFNCQVNLMFRIATDLSN
ncbi:MAG: DEAD/DEAH box helicase [Prochloraceae cyanobacterium]|nr:DEAD/DEAH box helicase [Prochloraceae cyanobacterium]